MASQLIVFVILAAAAHSSFGVQGTLSSSQLQDDYSGIEVLYNTSVNKYLNGTVAVFNEIKQNLAELAGKNSPSQLLTNSAETLSGYEVATDSSFDATGIVNPEAAVSIATARASGYTQLAALIPTIYGAIKVARSSILEILGESIEVIEAAAVPGTEAFIVNFYVPLTLSRGTNSKSAAAIQSSQDKSVCRLVTSVRNIFKAIKLLRDARRDGSQDAAKAALSEVELIQEEVLATLRREYRSRYNFFKSCLVADSLLEAIDFIDSTAIAASEDEAISKYQTLVNATKTEVTIYLDKAKNGTAGYFCTI